MIEKIEVNFDFGNLLNKLDNILEENMNKRKNLVANGAKEIIRSGKLRKNTKGTLALRKKGVAKGGKSSSTLPLIHTGNLLKSIKKNNEGIEFLHYGEHHLSNFIIRENKWTKKFVPNAIHKVVKKRNFLPITPKNRIATSISKRMKMLDILLHKAIIGAIKKRV